jgi:hypothetical protein
MPPVVRRLHQVLDGSAAASPLLRHLARLENCRQALEPLCASIVPGLDLRRPESLVLRGETLILRVGSNALAGKLRQASPRLLAGLRQRDRDLSEIRIEHQPARDTPAAAAAGPIEAQRLAAHRQGLAWGKRSLAPALGFCRKLALTLSPGALSEALLRLDQGLSQRLAHTRESDQSFKQQDEEKNASQPEADRQTGPRTAQVTFAAGGQVKAYQGHHAKAEQQQQEAVKHAGQPFPR